MTDFLVSHNTVKYLIDAEDEHDAIESVLEELASFSTPFSLTAKDFNAVPAT